MRRWFALWFYVATFAVNCSGTALKSAGIEQFWMDDYKAFENLYSRTSDKDLYRRSILPTVPSHEITKTKYHFNKELYKGLANNEPKQFGDLFDADESPYADRYIRLLAEQTLKSFDKTKPKPATKYFTNSYFKPINRKNNADLYNYLERLESYENRDKASSKYRHEKSPNRHFKHALVYSVPSPVRCGKASCSGSKRPSKISQINGAYLKRVKHKIVRY